MMRFCVTVRSRLVHCSFYIEKARVFPSSQRPVSHTFSEAGVLQKEGLSLGLVFGGSFS